MRQIFLLVAIIAALFPAVVSAADPRPLAPSDLPPSVLLSILRDAKNAKSVTVLGDGKQITVHVENRAPISAPEVPPATQQQPYRFQTLYILIPEIAGSRAGTAYSSNGDNLQTTTTGLFVWRKASNSAAFTDGFRTWVLGPYGLQQRLNTELFDWERTYADL